ncbi:MAG: signal peptidase II [Oscillospiraceae bacterium]|nr:signal peptidase II [Oscillospiraceae bacterium]
MTAVLIAVAVCLTELAIRRAVKEKGDEWKGDVCLGLIRRENVCNRGLFLGFLRKNRLIANILAISAMCAAAAYGVLRGLRGMAFAAQLGWGLVLGGGLSNAVERLVRGHVTDYLSLPRAVPRRLRRVVFNLADVCVFIGAVIVTIFDR